MRIPVKVLMALLLTVSLLTGCSRDARQTITCRELTISLPSTYTDLSLETYAGGLEFLYGDATTCIQATREEKEILKEYFPNIDALQYAELCLQSHALPGEVEILGGIPSFTYTADSDSLSITYLCGVFETETHFWLVQAYCASEHFAENQSEMWNCITSVTIA